MNTSEQTSISKNQPIQMQHPMKKYRKQHLFLIGLGAVGFSGFFGFAPILLLFGGAIGYLIFNWNAAFKIMKLNRAKHPLPISISQEELYQKLSVFLQHPDLKVENKKHCINVSFRNKSNHFIWLDDEEKTYHTLSRSQTNRIFKDRHNPSIKEYS
ncbi:hypothetical protein PTI45_02042 [Paenibacillus nuruki]|uniref:Uncharacterized protein n=1 Tax=Paenibacillus nuruki TaxID=1886670 RepID=A0A1E3L3V7_9BACL|nr:hypothetical protein [Paenibacillus nuruki]ODP28497.1 hypothetical protein PTI45_02042 [Paenibacillus nuruki]